MKGQFTAIHTSNNVTYDKDGNTKIEGTPISTKQIEDSLRTLGPLSVGFASGMQLRFYSKGVFRSRKLCSTEGANHSITIVGMDEDNWLIQNSWGKMWGDKGYFRIKKLNKTSLDEGYCVCGFKMCWFGTFKLKD